MLDSLANQLMDFDSNFAHNEPEDCCSNNSMKKQEVGHTVSKRKQTQLVATSSRKKSRVTRSEAWNHFTRLEEDSNYADCNYCGRRIKCNTVKIGTHGMNRHLKRCDQYKKFKATEDMTQQVLAKGATRTVDGNASSAVSLKFNQNECQKAVIKMLVLDELPFNFIESVGFRHFCREVCPLFNIPSRRIAIRDIVQLYADEKGKLKSIIGENGQRVSFTIDIRTSIHNSSYMAVTAHFIDPDWNLYKKILSFSTISSHNGDMIGKHIEDCLLEWGIDKVFTITVDNASANEIAINYLKKKLRGWREDSMILNGEFMYVSCFTHILNFIISDGLKDLHESIICIRNAIKYVKSHISRGKSFKNFVEREKIEYQGSMVLDVPTRWNSTYLMLATAIKFQKAFDRMAEEDGLYLSYFMEEENGKRMDGPPTSLDWENAKRFVMLFKTFYDVTLKFSTSLGVTSNICFAEICTINATLSVLCRSEDYWLASMASKMKTKYDKYWESFEKVNKLFIIAMVLDPRCKMRFAEFCFVRLFGDNSAEIEEMKKVTKDLLFRLYQTYSAWYDKLNTNVPTQAQQSGGPSSSTINRDMVLVQPFELDIWSCYLKEIVENDPKLEETNEVERYLIDKVEHPETSCFDILCWWRINEVKYPILARIARDILAIPISTVPSELAFSTESRILDSFQSSLTPKILESLICVQNWLQS